MEENNKPLSREEIEISNIGGVDSTIYGKDKIINLNTLIHKINSDYKFIQANFEDSLTINYLKHQCFLLEEFILDAQEFADVTNVNEKRKRALIWNIKKAREIQQRFENVLVELGTFRDIDNENELFAAFDFNLDSDNSGNIKNSKPNLVHDNKLADIHSPKRKAGRKPSDIKDASYYLLKIEDETNKTKFLNELKKRYQNVEHNTFNCLIQVLNNLGYLKPANNNAIKISFEKALERQEQSQNNFNKQFKVDYKESKKYKVIHKHVTGYIQNELIV